MVTENEAGFSHSIVSSQGVDTWLGDGARLNHRDDWIKLKGRPEVGSSFSVMYEFNKGDFDKMPDDAQFSLQPGATITISNKEHKGEFEGVYFDVVVKYIGPAPAFQEPDNGPAAEGGLPVMFPRLRAFIDNFRGAQ